MANPALIQKQIKDNSEDLHNFVRDLNLWEQEMKRKDRKLSNEQYDEVLPPIRRPKLSEKPKEKKEDANKSKTKRIQSYDYKAWDTFDVEKACEEVDNEGNKTESDEDIDLAKREENYMKEKALYEKELGNQHVKACRWDKAIESYSKAISAYPKDPVFYANRALCYLKNKQYDKVEVDCTASLKLDPTYVKALMRRAAARELLGQLEDARNDLTLALRLEPHNAQAQRDLARVKTANVENKSKKLKAVKTESSSVEQKEQLKGSIQTLPSPNSDKNKILHPSQSSSVIEAKEIQDKDSTEPNWIPCENTIEAVFKPPHLRSKKSLKQIQIHDVGTNVPKHVCLRKHLCQKVPTEVNKVEPSLPKMKNSQPETNSKSAFSIKESDSAGKSVPPPPKSSVQFHLSWNRIESDKALCFKYLKQIPGTALPDIFKESLESRMFSSIVDVLASEFVAANEPVMQYLKGLSGVRRFSTIVLFMSQTDKSNLKTLFKYCENRDDCSPSDIQDLQKLYELF